MIETNPRSGTDQVIIDGPTNQPGLRPRKLRVKVRSWETGLAVALPIELVVFSVLAPGFFAGFAGLLGLTQLFVPSGLVSLGLVVVILMGEIDLSVGAVAAVSSVAMAAMWQAGMNIWLAAVLALVGSVLLGCINAALVVRLGVASLIVTLATDFIYSAVAAAIAGSSPPYGFPPSFTYIGQKSVAGVPLQLVIFSAAAAVIALTVHRTVFGRSVLMMGYNRQAARYVGIRTERILIIGYGVSALMAGLAGVMLASYYGSVQPTIGDPLLLAAVTVIVLGGVDIFGGDGHISGVVIAVMIVGFFQQGLLIAGYADLVESMATGIVLVFAIGLRMGLRSGDMSAVLARFRLSRRGLS